MQVAYNAAMAAATFAAAVAAAAAAAAAATGSRDGSMGGEVGVGGSLHKVEGTGSPSQVPSGKIAAGVTE
jgi:hypothetical protein